MCWNGGFTQSWAGRDESGSSSSQHEPFTKMEKIPVIILVKLMLGLQEAQSNVVDALTGAYSICMKPDSRTCVNVIVGRHVDVSTGGFVLDKFSLYYQSNADVPQEWGSKWDLLRGYAFWIGLTTLG